MKSISLPAPILTFLAALGTLFGITPHRIAPARRETLSVETEALDIAQSTGMPVSADSVAFVPVITEDGITSAGPDLPEVIVPEGGVRLRKTARFLTHRGERRSAKVVAIDGTTVYLSRYGCRPFSRQLV